MWNEGFSNFNETSIKLLIEFQKYTIYVQNVMHFLNRGSASGF